MVDGYMVVNKESQDKSDVRLTYIIHLLIVLWHYYMTSSMVLRINANLFWPFSALVGVLLYISRRRAFVLNIYDMFLYFSISIMIISFLWTSDFYSSYKYTLSIIVYYIVARTIIMYTDNYKYVISLIYFFSILMAILASIQMLLPNFFHSYLLTFLPTNYHSVILSLESQKAYTGFTIQTSMNALYMSIGVGVAYFKFMNSKKYRLYHTIMLLLFLIILINTNRRGSLVVIVFLLTVMTFLAVRNKVTGTLLIISFTLLLAAIGIERIPGLTNILYKTSFYANSGDLSNGRLFLWDYAIQGFKERPILGYGIKTYPLDISAHNSYLQILYELGFIGAIVFFLPHIYILVKSIKSIMINRTTNDSKQYILLSLFIQILFILTAFFEGIFQDEISVFMLFIFQLIGLNKLSNHKEEAKLLKIRIKR